MKAHRDTTARHAKALWDDCFRLEPVEFQSRFDAIYAMAEGPATLWQLGGAANDFLRRHPGAIAVPGELARTLIDSSIVDGRIIGLKLLARTSADFQEVCVAICKSLESKFETERGAALFVLTELLDRRPPTTLAHRDLLPRLTTLKSLGPEHDRQTATRLSERLAEENARQPDDQM